MEKIGIIIMIALICIDSIILFTPLYSGENRKAITKPLQDKRVFKPTKLLLKEHAKKSKIK